MADGLDEFLQHISSQAHAGAGVEEGTDIDEESLYDAAAGVTLAEATHVVNVPVQNGHGTLKSEKKTTLWVTIEGTVTVTAPPNGTWNITATDLVADKTVFQATGLAANQAKWFSYKTGSSTQLSIVADWSVQADTALVLELKTNH